MDGLPPAGTSIPFHGRETDVESQAKQLRKHPAVLDYSPAKHAGAKCVDIGIIEVSPISRIDIAAIHVRQAITMATNASIRCVIPSSMAFFGR